MHNKPSHFSSQADYEKLKITSKQKTLTLDCGPSSFFSSVASCLSFLSQEQSCTHSLHLHGIKAKERLFGRKMGLPLCLHMKSLTMAMKIKVTSECGVSFKQKSPSKIILLCNLLCNLNFLVSHCYLSLWSQFTQKRSFLDYNVFCTNQGNTQKELWTVNVYKLNNRKRNSENYQSFVGENFYFGFQFCTKFLLPAVFQFLKALPYAPLDVL